MLSHQTATSLHQSPLPPSAQVHWVLCVQESVLNSVVDRLRLRMLGMKCVALNSDKDRALVDAAVQEAQQQGATVSRNPKENWGDVQNECLTGEEVPILTVT